MKQNRKIKIYLIGGLGNNLFQFYYGFLLEKRGYKVSYYDNLIKKNIYTKILGWTIHKNDITKFNIKDKIQTKNHFLFFIDFLKLTIANLTNKSIFNSLFDISYQWDTDYVENPPLIISGYLQGHKYFDNLNLNSFTDYAYVEEIKKCIKREENISALHIRGGDLLNENLGFNNFYFHTLKMVDLSKTICYTNDTSFAKKLLQEIEVNEILFSENKSSLEDFLSILNSSTIICANSTFSFWAAIYSEADIIYFSKNFDLMKNKHIVDNLCAENRYILI